MRRPQLQLRQRPTTSRRREAATQTRTAPAQADKIKKIKHSKKPTKTPPSPSRRPKPRGWTNSRREQNTRKHRLGGQSPTVEGSKDRWMRKQRGHGAQDQRRTNMMRTTRPRNTCKQCPSVCVPHAVSILHVSFYTLIVGKVYHTEITASHRTPVCQKIKKLRTFHKNIPTRVHYVPTFQLANQ